MRLGIDAAHAGFEFKQNVRDLLRNPDHQVLDVGTHSADPVDYPNCSEAVSVALREGRADRGTIICGSGVGASVAANKIPGIRAGLCQDIYSGPQEVEDDDMKVLVLGARVIGMETAYELIRAYVGARFNGKERHRRRLAKVIALEARYAISSQS